MESEYNLISEKKLHKIISYSKELSQVKENDSKLPIVRKKELLKEMHQSLKILEQRFVEGLIGEEIAIGLFGEERTKELKEKITKH